ncbi:PIP5K4, partial [Symbiodinium sp. CCMP2456]
YAYCLQGHRSGQPDNQGHHKSPSVQLYSRDDTLLALDLQAQIAQACADGWRPTRPIARGGQPPTLEPPFEVLRSTPPGKFPLESFGEGLSRFIYSREAEMEKASLLQAEEDLQPTIEEQGGAAPSSPAIPDDDHEALLVARFAAEHDSSSDSDRPKDTEPSGIACRRSRLVKLASTSKQAMSNASASDLAKFLKDNAVHDVLAQALALKGLETVDDLAYAYPELASLDSLLSGLSDEDMGEMGAADALHGVQAARLR